MGERRGGGEAAIDQSPHQVSPRGNREGGRGGKRRRRKGKNEVEEEGEKTECEEREGRQ